MPNVEFIYEQTCPFVRDARRRLIEGFNQLGLMPRWSEWEVSDPHAPEHVRGLGSPTILIDGRDVSGSPREETENCCRIYTLNDEPRGVPPLEMVVEALKASGAPEQIPSPRERSILRSHAALLPAVGLAALPKLTCPACWPAYAGVLSSFGIGFVNYTPYLLPLTAGFLAISILSLAYRAENRRGYGPFLLGVAAGFTVVIGKFGFDNDAAMWAGLATLVVSSLWNSWPRQRSDDEAAVACGVCAR
ncbi:MAG: hypothetical protein RIC16_14685 [Rhodospirillales bacterium]